MFEVARVVMGVRVDMVVRMIRVEKVVRVVIEVWVVKVARVRVVWVVGW